MLLWILTVKLLIAHCIQMVLFKYKFINMKYIFVLFLQLPFTNILSYSSTRILRFCRYQKSKYFEQNEKKKVKTSENNFVKVFYYLLVRHIFFFFCEIFSQRKKNATFCTRERTLLKYKFSFQKL